MNTLSNENDIVVLKPSKEDLLVGAEYASLTLPWTFNRMMKNTSPNGQRDRGLNIAKGIVGQEMLRQALSRMGVKARAERKSHRDDDLFDVRFQLDNKYIHVDVKTIHHYTDYGTDGIGHFSPDLIIKNASYPGPDWRHFFPMLMAHTQIQQNKDIYVFAIASSIDHRKDIKKNRMEYRLTAFPYGKHLPFLSSKRLCLARENAMKGLYIKCSYNPIGLLDQGLIRLKIIGEWKGEVKIETVVLKKINKAAPIGPFSCIDSFQIEKEDFEFLYGSICIDVVTNDFKDVLLNAAKTNINIYPDSPLFITNNDFCNLILPSDYTIYYIGWIPKKEFLMACRKYTGWVWPLDSQDKYRNQSWTQITERDISTITNAGFGDCIQRKPNHIKAGWMKTSGRGPGACCYVYPNTGYHGGLKETNLYVLPQDLYVMSELEKYKG